MHSSDELATENTETTEEYGQKYEVTEKFEAPAALR
jgi:hypothetical protein